MAETEKKQPRVMMLCCPRSTSTLFCRAMTAVPGSEVFMDPYFCCNDAAYNMKLMGKSPDDDDLEDEDWRKAGEMLVGEPCPMEKLDITKLQFKCLKKALDNPDKDATLVFCKSISYPLVGRYHLLPDKSSNYRYSVLLRHPFRVFKSWRKGLYDIVCMIAAHTKETPVSWDEFHFMRDVPDKYKVEGRHFKELYDHWQYVKENLDPNPVILDSDELLSDPEGMLTKYCAALDIPYSNDLIRWDGDPKRIDGWWQPYKPLYDFQFGLILAENAMYATEFKKPVELPVLEDLSEDIKESYAIIKPFYEEMYNARLKP